MHKILYVILLLLSWRPWQGMENINLNNDILKFEANGKEDVILTSKEITEYNNNIKKKTDALYELNLESILPKQLIVLIESYALPSLPKYNDAKKEISNAKITEILNNRNLASINKEVKVLKGLTINRTNLRSFPTDISFYDNESSSFDRLQETALSLSTPVLVLHESKDQKYYFVMSIDYYGWVKKENVTVVSDEVFNQFLNPSTFIVITSSLVDTNNLKLDMGTKLPLVEEKENEYKVLTPMAKEILVKKSDASLGYLPYTSKNVLLQAFKYEGTTYSWGGKDEGVDCSSFIQNVYKTFGFVFPRNTASQRNSVGEVINLKGLTTQEKLKTIKEHSLSLLYQVGHVMLYLGQKNNKHYVIDAAGNKNILKVAVEELSEKNYLNNIEKLVLVK